ncbi:MAG: RdgB/HAM1 family non-canonical purine NTP pyrophosphatase [Flavobacteriaceae bacterium]|nr:RdgB/HAM1 family non-canonical purine NTP pyrophosphatase [Flavobacteriaceae bacterium]
MGKPFIVFATHNLNKIYELQQLVSKEIIILTLEDIGFEKKIQETGTTLKANALLKAKAVHEYCNIPTIADDTGLFVQSLSGAPAVHSARYAGENATSEENTQKLLYQMKGISTRYAYFETIFCHFQKGEYNFFIGKIEGEISRQIQGRCGFGYDSIFKPIHSDKTFGQMTLEEKNNCSHRSKAITALHLFLHN